MHSHCTQYWSDEVTKEFQNSLETLILSYSKLQTKYLENVELVLYKSNTYTDVSYSNLSTC